MSPGALALLAAASFVGTHFLLSHPLRRPLVSRVGEKGFSGIYSLVALATFGWLIWASGRLDGQPYWAAPEWVWALGTLLLWLGTILFVGSLRGNPALPGARRVQEPHGVLRITRHPMMWGFAIWGAVHMVVAPTPGMLILGGSVVLLALLGAALQDRKKERLLGGWRDWEAKTSYLPFGRGLAWPGWPPVLIGTAVFLVATLAHQWLGGMPAGPWRWL